MAQKCKIVAFAGSNHLQSINQQLAKHAATLLVDKLAGEAEIHMLDLNAFEMPIYSPLREQQSGIPQLARDFYNMIGSADGVIASFAEYNGSFAPAYKNVLDWSSRIDKRVYQDKPTLFMATSMGGRGAQTVLKAAMDTHPSLGADIVGHFCFGPFTTHFDVEKQMFKTPELQEELAKVVNELQMKIEAG